jgi:hypothetical protein
MDLPKCKTCGERHRAGPCPAFAKSGGGVESRHAVESRVGDAKGGRPKGASLYKRPLSTGDHGENPLPKPEVASGPPDTSKKSRAPAGSFDRKAYQRDYMRRRRAEKGAQ